MMDLSSLITDLFDLKIVGWAYGLNMNTELVKKAMINRGLDKNGIHHLAIFEFIESWYNNQRMHGTLGYITPNQKYNNYIVNSELAYYLILR